MLTFDEAMVLTRAISSPTAFEDEECRAYFDTLMSLPTDSLIVEVGLEYGRSSSIALQVAGVQGYRYLGIDVDVKPEWFDMSYKINPRSWIRVHVGRSSDAGLGDIGDITAILIDGDHSYEGVLADCEHFLPHVVKGGYLMAHDYHRESLPDVTCAIDGYLLLHPEWTPVGLYGTLGIWRRM